MDQFENAILDALPSVRRFALGLARSESDADDLVQSICEKLLNRRHQWNGSSDIRSWLFRMTQTTWYDEIRRRNVRRKYADNVAPLFGSRSEDGAARVESVIGLGEVEKALGDLPPDQKAAILLVCVEGLSYQAAADVLGCPIGTLTSRLTRGRLALVDRCSSGFSGKVKDDARK